MVPRKGLAKSVYWSNEINGLAATDGLNVPRSRTTGNHISPRKTRRCCMLTSIH